MILLTHTSAQSKQPRCITLPSPGCLVSCFIYFGSLRCFLSFCASPESLLVLCPAFSPFHSGGWWWQACVCPLLAVDLDELKQPFWSVWVHPTSAECTHTHTQTVYVFPVNSPTLGQIGDNWRMLSHSNCWIKYFPLTRVLVRHWISLLKRDGVFICPIKSLVSFTVDGVCMGFGWIMNVWKAESLWDACPLYRNHDLLTHSSLSVTECSPWHMVL